MLIQTNLAARVSLAVAAIILIAVAATTAIHLMRFGQVYEEFIQRRLDTIIADVRRDIVIGLDLGLSLRGIANLPVILARHGEGETDIVALTVYDCDGAVVAETGSLSGGAAPWLDFVGESRWQVFSDDLVAAGQQFDDAVGVCAGGISVRFDTAEYQATLAAMHDRLVRNAALSLLVIVPALFGMYRIFGRRPKIFRVVEADLNDVLGGRAGAVSPVEALQLKAGDSDSDRAVIEAYRQARPRLIAGLADTSTDKGHAS